MLKSIACVLALAAAVPATAETRVVRYDDLNLSAPAGVARLQRRIDSAARIVCGAALDYRQSLILQPKTRKCMVDARAGAMEQVAQREIVTVRGG